MNKAVQLIVKRLRARRVFGGVLPCLALLLAITSTGCERSFDLNFGPQGYAYPDLAPGPDSPDDAAIIRARQAKHCMKAARALAADASLLRTAGFVIGIGGYTAAGTSAFYLAGSQGLNQGGPKQQTWGRRGLEFAALSGAILAFNAIVDFGARATEKSVASEAAAYYALLHAQGYDDWDDPIDPSNSFDKCAYVIEEAASQRVLERSAEGAKESKKQAAPSSEVLKTEEVIEEVKKASEEAKALKEEIKRATEEIIKATSRQPEDA